MALRLRIKVEGDLQRKINALKVTAEGFPEAVSQIVRSRAFDVVANAKNLVPISTGALRRSIIPTFIADGFAAVIGSHLPYAARQEYDATLDHSLREGRTRVKNTLAGRKGTVIKGTAQSNPNATFGFLRKSLAVVFPFFVSDLQRAVDKFGTALEDGLL